MSGDSAMESKHEELRLLKEALWYMRWAIIFDVMAIIIQAVAIIEAIKKHFPNMTVFSFKPGTKYKVKEASGKLSEKPL